MAKRQATRDQLVKTGRIQFSVTERGQGIGTMIAGVDMENVRRAAGGGGRRGGESDE